MRSRTDLIREAQKTGSSSLCMLIDGTIKRFPKAIVDLDTPYLSGKVQALCMDDPVHDVIIGNVPGAKDPQLNCTREVPVSSSPEKADTVSENEVCGDSSNGIGGAKCTIIDERHPDDECEHGAAIKTRAMINAENHEKKRLKVVSVPGTEVSTEELIDLQKSCLLYTSPSPRDS